jgi:hypothetical protein
VVDFGKLVKRAKGLADQHGDKISGAVDKATDIVDKKTKGKHSAQLRKIDAAAEKLDKTPKGEPDAP